MPIVDVELVEDDGVHGAPSRHTTQALADALGGVFGSSRAGTWVRMRYLPRDAYAENDATLATDIRPVFVTVLKSSWPSREMMQDEIMRITEAVATLVERPEENVHVLYLPEAAGRIAFGGKLRVS